MKIVNTKLIYLNLSLLITSGTMLINRFVVDIPDWLVIILLLISMFALFKHFVVMKKAYKKS